VLFLAIKDIKHVNHTRPKNLNLFTIHFPLPAIVSILHRVSGFFLFLLIPVILWAFDYSLTSDGYDAISQYMSSLLVKFVCWVMLAAFCFHMVAGIRHLLSDMHIGDTLKMGRLTAVLVFVISIILVTLAGIWLW
jgi:succinate dehydrogenase / fumarate reductase cytochrome b subunit